MAKSADVLGVSAATLKTAVTAVLKERAERAAAVHLQQYLERQRQEKQRRAEDRKRERAEKEATKKTHQDEKVAATVKHQAEKAAANARQEAEKEAERKRKERAKALGVILRLRVLDEPANGLDPAGVAWLADSSGGSPTTAARCWCRATCSPRWPRWRTAWW